MPIIHTQHISLSLSGTPVVTDVSLEVGHGEFVGIVGPNGSGKTTLLRGLHRALKPQAGAVLVGMDDLWQLSANEAARRIAVVSQENQIGFDFTTSEVAAMGRIPYKQGFARDSDADRQLIAQSLSELGLAPLAHRSFDAMSGGERQRTLIARALVQQAPILLLDEPTNHLDIHYQLDVLHRVHSLKLTTIAALHDLNLAAAWCQRIYVIDRGQVVASGAPHEALAADLISRVFRVQATAFTHPVSGKHQLLFDRTAEEAS
ncbi:MAG: ABC transporter ATP-binding protein [Chloroflexales bacterium]|jgi:iron complex transport system ATP-binding protein|nr:ABC transporter ATP-binding protein [Chloroflexales bacterium]